MQPQMFSDPARRWWGAAGLCGLAFTLSACGEDATAQTPQRLVKLIQGEPGFGATLAAGGTVGTATVWGGMPASVSADARRVQKCQIDLAYGATPTAVCTPQCAGQNCPLPMGAFIHLWNPLATREQHCFATGVEATAGGAVQLRCEVEELSLVVPTTVSMTGAAVAAWRPGADSGVSPVLAVASPVDGRAWFYPAASAVPVELFAGTASSPVGFATDVAVLRLGPDRYNSRFIAVSNQTLGQVWLFRSGFPNPEIALRTGCLGDRPEFGRRMASGDVDGDGLTDLLVADDQFVTVFSGTALAMVDEQAIPACSLASLPDSAILASVSCASGGLTSGCFAAEFGASIVVADLDGDSDGEILIGAPAMTVAGEQTGALLVYDAEGDAPHELTETVTGDQLPTGARFGASLAAVRAEHIDSVIVGAPGMGGVFLAPCFSITPAELRPKVCGGS